MPFADPDSRLREIFARDGSRYRLALAIAWRRRFARGPAEWAMRRLSKSMAPCKP